MRTQFLAFICFTLLLSFVCLDETRAQAELVISETTIQGQIPVSREANAIVFLYSPLPNLSITSPREFEVYPYNPQNQSYLLLIEPDLPITLSIRYPGFSAESITIPATPPNRAVAFEIKPPTDFDGAMAFFSISDPSATLSINGILVGSPEQESDSGIESVYLSKGTHTITVRGQGYELYEETIQIAEDGPNSFQILLTRTKIPFSITSNIEGARVSINDEYVGETPFSRQLPQGIQVVQITSPGYEIFTQRIDVGMGKETTLYAELVTAIKLVPQGSRSFITAQQTSISNGVLVIDYTLSDDKKKYKVATEFLDISNSTVDVTGVSGGGKRITGGETHRITWPIDQTMSLKDMKIRLTAKAHSNTPYILAGIAVAGGGVCLVTFCAPDDPEPGLADSPPGRPPTP